MAMDVQLLLHRGKIAGKALSNVTNAHGNHDQAAYTPTCRHHPRSRAAPLIPRPALAVYNPCGAGRKVEFSCSNTRSYQRIQLTPTKRGGPGAAVPTVAPSPDGSTTTRPTLRSSRSSNDEQLLNNV